MLRRLLACRKSCAFPPSCLRTGPLAPFAAHGGFRRSLRSTRLGTGPAGRRGVILNEKGVLHPFLAAFAAWLALCCAKMHGFATASFFPGRFFYFFAFFNSLFCRCGFQLAFSLHLKFPNTTRFDFSIGSLPPFTSSFYSNSHHFVSRATTRIRPLSLWLSQVLNVKSCSPHCAPAPPQ